MDTEKVFDRESLNNRLGNDEELISEIIGIFLEDLPAQIGNIEKALEERNSELVTRHAHTIKGASSNIGAMALSATALKIEMAGNDGDPESARAYLDDLKSQMEKFKDSISASGILA